MIHSPTGHLGVYNALLLMSIDSVPNQTVILNSGAYSLRTRLSQRRKKQTALCEKMPSHLAVILEDFSRPVPVEGL